MIHKIKKCKKLCLIIILLQYFHFHMKWITFQVILKAVVNLSNLELHIVIHIVTVVEHVKFLIGGIVGQGHVKVLELLKGDANVAFLIFIGVIGVKDLLCLSIY